jgi:dinuclear metal center YbgI/SA1388 family protein
MAHYLSEIIDILDSLAPRALAEEWDNCGLQLGDLNWPVKKIWVALDPTLPVVEAACGHKVDLLVTHHPLIFRPLKAIEFHTPLGSIIHMATRHHLAIFAAHTNLDSVTGGLNDILARRLGLDNLEPLSKIRAPESVNPSDSQQGIGRIGILDKAIKLKPLAQSIKKDMGLETVRFAGDPNLLVNRAAVCTGSGSSLLKDFFASGAQVYISGDIRYHDARDVEAANLGVIDVGHFSSESFVAQDFAALINKRFEDTGIKIAVEPCSIEKDPFEVL